MKKTSILEKEKANLNIDGMLWILENTNLGHPAGILVVGEVLLAAVVYLPSSPPGVAVGPEMNLVSADHHVGVQHALLMLRYLQVLLHHVGG